MINGELLYLVATLAASGFISAIGIPLFFGLVPPNKVYGIRTAKTLSDSGAWYSTNRVCGFWTILTGLATAGVSTGMYAAGISIPVCLFFTLVAAMSGVIVMSLQSDSEARRPGTTLRGAKRQFRLLTLFVATTAVAIGCAIMRLPGPWELKAGLLWAYIICIAGLTIAIYRHKHPMSDIP
jgi:uncharacterized membrane protein